MKRQVVITGAFDRLQAREVRLLEEAAKFGNLTVLLWSDELAAQLDGVRPKFPETERRYCLEAIRFVHEVRTISRQTARDSLPEVPGLNPNVWAMPAPEDNDARQDYCRKHGLDYRVISEDQLASFPDEPVASFTAAPGRKKVVVTGCYDWFHSGHVRFCEEVSSYGDLYVIVGSDANVRLLKGAGHPLFPQQERRYVAASLRCVRAALISTGEGWLDGDPEIRRIQPDIFAVNEDGDKGGKREYCAEHGMEYLVLKRVPAPGLAPRTSTDLRGF